MIGFVIPLEQEVNTLLPLMEDLKKRIIQNRKFYEGRLGDSQCRIVVSGRGKIMSAAGTQLLLSLYPCKQIIHMGSGGALSQDLKIGDFVVGEEVIEHDYIEQCGGRRKKPTSFSDVELVRKLCSYASDIGKTLYRGKIVSGNEDVVESSRRDQLLAEHGGLSVDWESCGCASVCNQAGIPVLVVRAISDYAYENTKSEYNAHASNVNKLLSEFLSGFIKQYLP